MPKAIKLSFEMVDMPVAIPEHQFRLVPPTYYDHFWQLQVKGRVFWYDVKALSVYHDPLSPFPDGRAYGWTVEQITNWAMDEASKWCAAKYAPSFEFTMRPRP
jgi:hypothetical protein